MASPSTSTEHSETNTTVMPLPFTPPRQTAPANPTYSSPPELRKSGSSPTIRAGMGMPNRPGQPKKNRIANCFASLYENGDKSSCAPMHEGALKGALKGAIKGADLKGRPDENVTARGVSTLVQPSNTNGRINAMQDRLKEAYSTSISAIPAVDPTARKFLGGTDKKGFLVLPEWLGTSPYNIRERIAIQKQGLLNGLISYRKAILHDIPLLPYHPHFYIELSRVDNKLGFCDVGVANAYRALALINAGLCITKRTYPEILGLDVRSCVAWRLNFEGEAMVIDELEDLQRQAFCQLLRNLLGVGAFWDGLLAANDALKLFPRDVDLHDLKTELKDAFETRCRSCLNIPEADIVEDDILVAFTRRGSVYQKPYPWLDKSLYTRSPALVKQINQNLGTTNCEVRQVIFGDLTTQVKTSTENEDVGPLGIFATKDIHEGDLLMVDRCFMNMSDVPSSRLSHCDACHASVRPPYMHKSQVIKPRCCKWVVYCSVACYEAASNGYHRIACGKKSDWLYKDKNGRYSRKVAGENWRSILFLRIMCIILSDRRTQRQNGEEPTHPLQHPLIIRLTAKSTSPFKLRPKHSSDWAYFENVVLAHRILEQLNIDVYTNSAFTPEVIQTIYWRAENNASQSTVNLSVTNPPNGTSSGTATHSRQDHSQDINILCLNPNYCFFNHSCEPNVEWHGSAPNPWVGISWLKDLEGNILPPGCSAVWCIAKKDIKKGEELKISYVGNPMGSEGFDRQAKRNIMEKWFEGGCGCNTCTLENQTGAIDHSDSEDCGSEGSGSEDGSSEEGDNEWDGSSEEGDNEEDGCEEDCEVGELAAQMSNLI